MQEVKLTEDMKKKAVALNLGKVLYAYKDEGVIRMETENGDDPYVWRDNTWRRMKPMWEA